VINTVVKVINTVVKMINTRDFIFGANVPKAL